MNRSYRFHIIVIIAVIALIAFCQPGLAVELHTKGINIDEYSEYNLTDFQVGIRLNATNFDFSLAQPDGSDVRFTDENGQALPFWIEEWDPIASSALIWVKVPSIPPISTTIITLQYGDGLTVSSASGEATFLFFDDFDDAELDFEVKWSSEPYPPDFPLSTASSSVTVSGGEIHTRQNFSPGVAVHGYGSLDAPIGPAYFGLANATGAIQLFADDTNVSVGNVQGRAWYIEPSTLVTMEAPENPDPKRWSVMWPFSSRVGFQVDEGLVSEIVDTSTIPPGPIPVSISTEYTSSTAKFDWVFVKKHVYTEPTVYVSSAVAEFSADRTYGPVNMTVQFTDPYNGLTIPHRWDFGDGTNATVQSPAHTYTAPGTYNVTLRVETDPLNAASLTKYAYITVHEGNLAPEPVEDSYMTDPEMMLAINTPGVLGNDADIDEDMLTAYLVTGPANGTLDLYPNGSFVYVPESGFIGTDSFTYVANDGALNSSPAAVNIIVEPLPPVGGDTGWFIVHCNVNGASVYFTDVGNATSYEGAIENGTLLVEVYTTATPLQSYTVTKEGYTSYSANITNYPPKDGSVDLYAKIYSAYYLLNFSLSDVSINEDGGQYVEIWPSDIGTVTWSGDDAIVSGRSSSIPQITYHLIDAIEGDGIIFGLLAGADLTTREFGAWLPSFGQVYPFLAINLSAIPISGQLGIGILEGSESNESPAFYEYFSSSGYLLESLAYILEVEPLYPEGYNNEGEIFFTMARSWADAYGSDHIRVLRRDSEGIITMLETEVVSETEVGLLVRAYSPDGFSSFALVAVEEKATPTPTPTERRHRDDPDPTPRPPEPTPQPPEPTPSPPEPTPPVIEPEILPEPIPDVPEVLPVDPVDAYFTGLQSAVQVAMATHYDTNPITAAIPDEISPFAAVATGIGIAGLGAAFAGSSMVGASGGETASIASGSLTRGSSGLGRATSSFSRFMRLDKLWDFIRRVIGYQVLGYIGSKEIQMRKIAPNQQTPTFLGLSSREGAVILASMALFFFAFAFAGRVELNWLKVGLFILMSGVAVLGHELVTDIVARRNACDAEFKFWGLGTLIMFVNAGIFGIAFGKPSRTLVAGTNKLAPRDQGMLLLLGPLVNIIFALGSLLLIPFGGILAMAGAIGFPLNMMVSVYTLVPVHPLKGRGIFEWNRMVWAAFFIPLVVIFITVYLIS
ncbi:MAG: DUF2341 domain-containing protein [Methanomicrobiaceae archaeon]|nr:DUF2341 domain-containing protein [Methanomicrobiaceae archaeon]